MSFNYSSLAEKRELILAGKLDLIGNVTSFLKKIEENSDINAFLHVNRTVLMDAEVLLEKLN